jgi:hypothetical protein
MIATPDIIIFQKDFSGTTGKPERKSGFLPAKMYGYKCRKNLNKSNMCVSGEFGKCEQIKKCSI